MPMTWLRRTLFAGCALSGTMCAAGGEPGVYEAVSSKVSSLAAQLNEMELANKHALEKLKQQLEQDVATAKQENMDLAKQNAKLAEENTKTAITNKQLRLKADGLVRDVKTWEADFRDLHANFSTSMEFTSTAMKALERGSDSSKLQVLKDLEKQETEGQAEKVRMERLAAIHKASRKHISDVAALIQVPDLASNPKSFLRALGGDLQDMKNTVEHDKQELRQTFEVLFKQERARHTTLEKERDELLRQRDELNLTQTKLRSAVSFLENTFHALESNARSLRMFASRIGIRPLPRSHSKLDVPEPETEIESDDVDGLPTMRASQNLRHRDA